VLEQKILAVNGVLVSTLGYKAPVLTEQGEAWVLGGSRRFPATSLPELASEGLLTLLEEPVPFSEALRQGAQSTGPEELGREYFHLPCYVFYADLADLAALEKSIGVLPDPDTGQSSLASIVNQSGECVKIKGAGPQIAACALNSGDLRTALQNLYHTTYRHLMDLLVSEFRSETFEQQLRTTADRAARFLYLTAFDDKSARRAISLRTVTLWHGSEPDLWMHWTLGAAKAWSLTGGVEAWAEQGRAMILSLLGRRIARDASIMREPVREFMRMLAEGRTGALKYTARNVMDFQPVLAQTNISLPKENPRYG
jgi:hypothetical protein